MPVYKGNVFIKRIEKANELPLRRVFKGHNNLTYGLYDIDYQYHKNGNEIDGHGICSEEPPRYVWGEGVKQLPDCSHTNASSPREQGRGWDNVGEGEMVSRPAKCEGWFNNTSFEQEMKYIDIDSKEDVPLYQLITQEKTMYKYTWQVTMPIS